MNRPEGQKCGNCAFFQVRNEAEADLARVAKNESECAPGEWVFQGERKIGCHGGPVRGLCAKWRERKAQGPAIFSTQWCPLWAEGGPVLRSGSINKPSEEKSNSENSSSNVLDRHSVTITSGLVAALAAAGWWRQRQG